MSIDVIKSIKQAEAEAEEVIKKSTEDSRQILSDASNQSKSLLEESLEAAEKEAKVILFRQKSSKCRNREVQ